MERLFGSHRVFLRSHFHKPEPQGFPSVTSDHSGGYHVPMGSEDVIEILIRKGLRETFNEQ